MDNNAIISIHNVRCPLSEKSGTGETDISEIHLAPSVPSPNLFEAATTVTRFNYLSSSRTRSLVPPFAIYLFRVAVMDRRMDYRFRPPPPYLPRSPHNIPLLSLRLPLLTSHYPIPSYSKRILNFERTNGAAIRVTVCPLYKYCTWHPNNSDWTWREGLGAPFVEFSVCACGPTVLRS